MVRTVVISKQAQKQLRKVPKSIVASLAAWVADVEDLGLEEVRKIPGYHDEPLVGDRKGQRSIRLNSAWRAFYVIVNGHVTFVSVIEVNHHDY